MSPFPSTVKLSIARVATGVIKIANAGASAAYLHVSADGSYMVCDCDTGLPYLATVKWDFVDGAPRSMRAAGMIARVLINRAADHAEAYPAMFPVEIQRVNVPRSF